MRTLGDILSDMRRPYHGEPPAELLVETCQVLAACADPDRCGERRPAVVVDEILAAYQRRVDELTRATAAWLGAHGEEVA